MVLFSGPFLWETLQTCPRPIWLYGMGNGAEKLLQQCRERGIKVTGVFASDGFVRGQTFMGYTVKTLSQAEEISPDLTVLLAFGSSLPEVMERIDAISRRHPLYAPDLPLFGGEVWDRGYYEAHRGELEAAYGLLGDDQSRLVFDNLVRYRLSGDLSFLAACETPREEIYRLLDIGEEDYFDLGAYDGDTVREVLAFTGNRLRSVTAVEPDPKNAAKLLRRMPQFSSDPSFTLVQAAVWRESGRMRFDAAAGRSASLAEDGKSEVRCLTIDEIVGKGKCTFLKMDVEGAEEAALLGAQTLLRAQRPKLLFSAYHRSGDLFALPELLHRIEPSYRLYLRHQPYYPAWEVNFCARAD